MVNFTTRLLYARDWPIINCIGGWLGPRAGREGCGKSCPYRDSIPELPSPKITISGLPNLLNYCAFFTVNIICKCARGPHNATWRAAGWTPMRWALSMCVACPAYLIFLKTHISVNVPLFNLTRVFIYMSIFSTKTAHTLLARIVFYNTDTRARGIPIRKTAGTRANKNVRCPAYRRSVLSGLFWWPCVTWHAVQIMKFVLRQFRLQCLQMSQLGVVPNYLVLWLVFCFERLQVIIRTLNKYSWFSSARER